MLSVAQGESLTGGPPSFPALLEVRDISVEFGGATVVRDCSFSLGAGSVTGLIGPNGAGKTTVFNVITGLIKPGHGTVLLEGREISGQQPHRIARAGIGRTFQITRELDELTVLENVVLQSAPSGIRAAFGKGVLTEEREKALELLSLMGLSTHAEEPAKRLSYGQKKLLELAGVLMADPRLIMLDEPAGGVKPRLLEDLIARLRELNRQGVTLLIVEHNMDVLMDLSDSVIVMAHGEVLLHDIPDVVQRDDAVLQAYLGEA